MQVRKQVVNILRTQRLAIAGHLFAAEADDIGNALIVGRQSTQRKVLVLEHALERRPFPAAVGIWLVAAVAMRIVDLPSGSLLRTKTKLSVRFAPLDITADQGRERVWL
jgi:hypothetical protein